MLINDVGRLEIQKPFAMLVDDLFLPGLDGHPLGGFKPGVGGAGGMHPADGTGGRCHARLRASRFGFGHDPR